MTGLFQRLVGLETEYAIRFTSAQPGGPPPSKFQLFEALRAAVSQRVLTVPAKHFKEGVFSANGGALWFEAERPSAGGGLIEGATPECRLPKELIAYQRAQDRLLADSAAEANLAGELRLIKNDRDAYGNVYGAQENYQATLASGFGLFGWRLGLVLLFPVALLTWLAILLSVLATLCYFAVAGLIYLPVRAVVGDRRRFALLLFGRDLVDGRETCVHVPVWLESSLQVVTRALTAPLALSLFALLSAFAFRRQRGELTAFLISRTVFSGAGLVDADGSFQLADKAPAVNCTLGFGGMLFDRPIFSMGHFFKEIYAESWFSPANYLNLFAARQRLQIALGDSNMCESAELLRVGTTMLVLDACEAGALRKPPRLRKPIRGLRRICSDLTLAEQVAVSGGASLSALEIQRIYFERCSAYLDSIPTVPGEAWEILRLWKSTLDNLQDVAAGQSSDQLVGSVDWITKKYLLDNAADDGSWHERKKIDICYHELSRDGYFRMLEDAGITSSWISESAKDRAARTPPPNSPAVTRGRYIREFARTSTPITVNWKAVFLGRYWDMRVIKIADYGRPGTVRWGRSRTRAKHLQE